MTSLSVMLITLTWLGTGPKIMNNKTLVSKSDIFSLRDNCTSSQQFSREGDKKCSRGGSGNHNQADHIVLCVMANFLKEEMLNDEHLWNKVKGQGERRDSGHTDYLKDLRKQEKEVIWWKRDSLMVKCRLVEWERWGLLWSRCCRVMQRLDYKGCSKLC